MSIEHVLSEHTQALNNLAEALRELKTLQMPTFIPEQTSEPAAEETSAPAVEAPELTAEPEADEKAEPTFTLDDIKDAIQKAREVLGDDYVRATLIEFDVDANGKRQFGRLAASLDEDAYEDFMEKVHGDIAEAQTSEEPETEEPETEEPETEEPETEEPEMDDDDLIGDADPVTLDDLRREFGNFLKIDDAKERGSRKVFVQQMLQKLGRASRVTELPEDKWAAALAELKKYEPIV